MVERRTSLTWRKRSVAIKTDDNHLPSSFCAYIAVFKMSMLKIFVPSFLLLLYIAKLTQQTHVHWHSGAAGHAWLYVYTLETSVPESRSRWSRWEYLDSHSSHTALSPLLFSSTLISCIHPQQCAAPTFTDSCNCTRLNSYFEYTVQPPEVDRLEPGILSFLWGDVVLSLKSECLGH